jgi:hypothetical protein
LPIGTQDQGLLDARINDADEDCCPALICSTKKMAMIPQSGSRRIANRGDFKRRAAKYMQTTPPVTSADSNGMRPSLFMTTFGKIY